MADDNQNQNIENVTAENVQENPVQQVEQRQEKKLIPQSEVNKIVGGVKLDAYEKGRREALAEYEKQMAAQESISSSQNTNADNLNVTRDELERMIEEKSRQRVEQQQAQRVVEQFVGKMKLGIQKYNDFEETVTKLDIPNLPPQIIDWANSMDNTADIMYEISKSPGKFANLLTLTVTSPRLAYDEFVRLSDSIKRNEEAKSKNVNMKQNEPLDQVKHSTIGIDNGAPKSVSDFRKQSWLRG